MDASQDHSNAGANLIRPCGVWSTGDIPLNRRGGEKIIALVKKLRRNPPTPREYWVIRGDGEVIAQGCDDGHDIPVILPTYANPQSGTVD